MINHFTTDQMTTLLKTLTIFIDNKDPFTTENIINELKRDGDQFNGFYNDKGENIVDNYYEEIDDAIDSLMLQFYPDFVAEERRVYIYEPEEKNEDIKEDWDDEDDINVDKEGNKLPKEVYDVKVEDDGDGRVTYSLKPRFDEVDESIEEEEDRGAGWYKDPATGEWEWDRDAAASAEYANEWNDDEVDEEKEIHDVDHSPIYDLTVDKQNRITIKKKIFEEAKWTENERVIVIGKMGDHSEFYIIRYEDKESDDFELGENEYIFGDYELKNGALRIGTTALIDDVQPGDIMYAKVVWDDIFNYIVVSTK